MTFEVASVVFIESEVVTAEYIDMSAVLIANGMWLILEGFLNGYPSTEAIVDQLHNLVHNELGIRIN